MLIFFFLERVKIFPKIFEKVALIFDFSKVHKKKTSEFKRPKQGFPLIYISDVT